MPRLRISDHALLRWLERSGGLEVERLRAMLAASLERAFAAGASLNAERFAIVADGLVYIVRDDTLVSVYVDDGLNARIRALR